MKKINIITSFLLFSLVVDLASCSPKPMPSSEDSIFSVESSLDVTLPIVNFNATSPIDIPSNAVIKVAGSFNSWDPLNSDIILHHTVDREYSYSLPFTMEDIGTTIQYKYVLLYDNQTEGMWNFVEGGPTGQEIGNRTLVLKSGINEANDTIRSFKNNMDQTSLTRGTLTLKTLTMPQFSDKRQRTIRVWLPDGYDATNTSKRYPVMYMQDGQNLFDTYTAFAGEWQVDEALGAMMDKGYGGTIVVGIDNGPGRLDEYSPSWPFTTGKNIPLINAEGEKYAAFIVETLKPYIDQNFNTLTDKSHTGIGGSSMGGIISFFTALTYQDIFGYALIFSSSFWLYSDTLLEDFLAETIKDTSAFPKMYIYHGTNEDNSHFYMSGLRTLLETHNIIPTKYLFKLKTGGGHNEPSWASAFPDAYKWLVGI